MESRRLKRYDSAPISTGVSSSSSAAARTGIHISSIPRPQPSSSASGAAHSPLPMSKPTINASSASAAPAASPQESYEKQLETYYRCLEEDNQVLLNHYEIHTTDIASLKVLAQERKYKDAVFRSMEAKTAEMSAFLQEMLDLTSNGRGLRARGDTNAKDNASSASSSKGHNGKGPSSSAAVTALAPTMDSVRDAVQKQQAALQDARSSEEKYKQVIRSLEKDVTEWKEKARSRAARHRGSAAEDDEDCCLPGTAKELRDAQRRARDLERRLTAATLEVKDAAATIATLQQQHRTDTQALQRREEEVAAMHSLLQTKEQLLATLEEEAKSARRSTASTASRTAPTDNARYVRTNSAPAGAASVHAQSSHHSGGERSSDRLVVTHHYRLLGGQQFVDGQEFSAESFKDAFLRSVSTMLHIPYGYLSSVEVRTHAEAVSVELDIRHPSRVKEDEIDFLLLSHDYPEVITYLEKVKVELLSKKPLDRNAARVRELQALLAEKEQEGQYLRRKLRTLEDSLERRDDDREVLDKDVDAALRETESTVKELYEALQAAQRETDAVQKALSAKSAQLRSAEEAKEAAVDAVAAAERARAQAVADLSDRLASAHAEVAQARDGAMQTALLAQEEQRAELQKATFRFDIPLSSSAAQRTAGMLLQDAQQTRLLHTFLLGFAGRTAGAIPVQARKCVLCESTSSGTPAVLQATVELAFYASKKEADAVRADTQRKLTDGGSCTAVQEYVRVRTEAQRREATTIADAQRAVSEAEQRATAAIAAMQAETQQAQETQLEAAAGQLREIAARVSSVVPANASTSPEKANAVSRIDQLVARLTAAEAASRRHEEESARAARRLADAQQEREQLQQTLSELTTRCAEVRVAKEQLASRLATAEAQLKAAKSTAGESESVLVEKVKRLELALRTKTAAGEAEKKNLVEEARAAATASAARLAEMEDALAAKREEVKRLQAKLAAVASSSSSAATSAAAARPSSEEEAALREALKVAKQDRTMLARQVKEMETDMNDLSNIQAAMQRELESAQQELRAKKHDFDLLVKQLIRMEEKEKKWNADQHQQQQQQKQPQQQLTSPKTPTKQQDEDAERDDVARESLVVLTNSNASLQQCLRRLQETMTAMGMDVPAAMPTSGAGKASNGGGDEAAGGSSNGNGGPRRSGHRKSALGATVSRAAMEHQQLSTNVAELLFPLLTELQTSPYKAGVVTSSSSNSDSVARRRRGGDDASSDHRSSSGNNNASRAAAAGHHGNGYVTYSSHNGSGGGVARIVKPHVSNSPFGRTRSTPTIVASSHRGSAATNATDPAAHRDTPTHSGETEAGDAGAAYDNPTVMGSGGKATVDAAPRLDFHRQNSSRAYTRSNTATVASATSGPNTNNGSGLPPAAAAAPAEPEKERRSSRELPHRRGGGGGGASTASSGSSMTTAYASGPRRYNPLTNATTTTTTTAKSNPFRRSNTSTASTSSAAAAAGQAGGVSGTTSFVRMTSGYRRMPTSTTEAGSPPASQVKGPYRMRF